MRRRDVLTAAGLSISGTMLFGSTVSEAVSDPTIEINEQTTDGATVTVAKVSTNVDARFMIRNSDSEAIAGPIEFDAGTVKEDYQVELSQIISEDETVSANLYNSDGQGIARDTAKIHVAESVDIISGMDPVLVEADPAAGFNYPYYLYAPSKVKREEPGSILIQPTNSGQATDDFEVQKQSAENRINGGISRTIADRLSVPLLVPIFPRPRSEPVDWTHYVHALDRETMQISDGPLERVDLQLLRMAEDAQRRLNEMSYPFDEQIMLNGFSAAGNFVDRFTFLHPDRVRSVTAGGLNGTALLPLEEADGRTLNYHVGIADVEELTGVPVDLDALDEVNQFLYMGGEDSNDTIPYDDAWTKDWLRETALEVYGDNMTAERFPRCQAAYREAGVSAQFKIYKDAQHSPRKALDDIVEFHRRSIEGEDTSDFGEVIVPEAIYETSIDAPRTGERVTFDAGKSHAGVNEVLAYLWDFGDGETAVGEEVEHVFTESGQHTVRLTVITDVGTTTLTEEVIAVAPTGTELDPSIEVKSTTPTVGEAVEFDATGLVPIDGEVLMYTWDFDGEGTAVGRTITHAFDEPGDHEVTLEVITDAGRTSEVARTVSVEENELKPSFEVTLATPTVDESVEFDASASLLANGDILRYIWHFEGGETAVGPAVTHVFDQPGDHVITLEVISEEGRTSEVDKTVSVDTGEKDENSSDGPGYEDENGNRIMP